MFYFWIQRNFSNLPKKRNKVKNEMKFFVVVFFFFIFYSLIFFLFFLLKLLLGADGRGVAAALLAAVGRARREASVALAADLLLPVVFLGEGDESGLHDTTHKFEFEFDLRRHFFFLYVFCVVFSRGFCYLLFARKKELDLRGEKSKWRINWVWLY